ncbi:MAG: rod shape-determining protein MreC [Lachnospiraceae bacterium]|nr:rod shape-determining protein MreC [Lachnospiraceae bacterium]
MRKRNKFSVPSRYLFAGLALGCILLMGVSFITGFSGGPVNTVAGYLFVPIQRGLNSVGGWMRERTDNLESLEEAQALNEELQAQVDALIAENSRLQQDRYELAELRALYNLDETYGEYEKIAAKIIGKDAGNWFGTFLIDRGSKDGIREGMNVVAGSGLVGIVTKVGSNWAQVRSIIDDMSNVSATVLSTSDSCFVEGDLQLMNEGVIRITQLKAEEDAVHTGDKVITSHISDKYQEGILIGYVDELSLDSNNLTYSGTLTPAVDFEYLHTVLVITDLKQTAQEEE